MGDIKERSLSGVKWNAIGQFSTQVIRFVLGIVIARLLSPDDYGVVGMLAIFMAIAQNFVDSGFANALIRKIDRTEIDCSTVFYFNLVIALLLYGILFFSAPAIASFYDTPILESIIRVLSLTLVINSLGIVPRALRSAAVDFKTLAYASTISAILSGSAGVLMAYSGWGVWALVWQSIISSCVSVAVILLLARWRPQLAYSWHSFRSMFSYGSKLMASIMLNTVFRHISSLIIGKYYSPAELGYYDKGNNMASLPSLRLSDIFHGVTFPILSELQADDSRLVKVYHRYLAMTSMIIFFLMTLLFVTAKPLVSLLLTEKWLGAVPFLRVFCFAYMFDSVCRLNNNMFFVKGWSGKFLKIEILKKAAVIPVYLFAIPLGPLAICFVAIVHTLVDISCSTYYLRKRLGIELKKYAVLLKYFIISVLACAPAFLFGMLDLSPWISLPVGALTAISLYVGFLHKDENMQEGLHIICDVMKGKK